MLRNVLFILFIIVVISSCQHTAQPVPTPPPNNPTITTQVNPIRKLNWTKTYDGLSITSHANNPQLIVHDTTFLYDAIFSFKAIDSNTVGLYDNGGKVLSGLADTLTRITDWHHAKSNITFGSNIYAYSSVHVTGSGGYRTYIEFNTTTSTVDTFYRIGGYGHATGNVNTLYIFWEK